MLSQENKKQSHEDWKVVRCQDVIDVRDGTHDTPKYVSEGIPLITSKNLTNGFIDFRDALFISENDHQKIKKRSQVDEDDIIMPMIGTIGNPVIVKSKREFSVKNVALFKFNNNSILSKYFYYLLQSPVFEKIFLIDSRGVTQKFVSLQMLRDLQIPLPPIAEQKRIAAICAKADRLRRTRRYVLELSDTYLRSVFLEMFGDPLTNPKGWKIRKLEELLTIKPHIGTTQPAQDNGLQLCVRVGELGNWYVNLEPCQYVSLEAQELKRFSLIAGDIVLARAIGSESHLGKMSIVPKSCQPIVFDSHVMRLRLNNSQILAQFFVCMIRTEGGRARFMQQARQTAVQFNINSEQMAAIEVPLPPVSLQEKFAQIVQKHERIRAQQREALRQAEHLFQTILHRAFRDNGL